MLLAVLSTPAMVGALRTTLVRRFGADYRILATGTPSIALAALDRLRDDGKEVALVLADPRLPGMTGIDFLACTRASHPDAKRALLTPVGEGTDDGSLHRAMALGQIDLTIATPWNSPEESLYPRVGEALAAWWRLHRPRFERVRVVGEQWSARSHQLRDLGTRNAIPFGFYAADSEEGLRLLGDLGLDASHLPVVTFSDGRFLVDPSNAEIAEALGAATHPPPGVCDVAIIGGGPAGLAAAVYAASEGLRTVVVEPEALGGQAGTSSMIRNYLGFPRGIRGEELARRAYEQALHFGAHFVHTRAATGLRADGRLRVVTLSDGSEIVSRAVVLATGVSYRRLGIPALERLIGAGVFYGAAPAEAQALHGEEAFVVGAGNSAGQAALHLAEFAARVTLLVRGDSLVESMSDYLIHQLEATPNVEVRVRTRLIDGKGEHRLEGLVLEDVATGRTESVPADALFVLIGGEPRTGWLDEALSRDADGYVLTCRDLAPRYEPLGAEWPLTCRRPLLLETRMPGVFAVGDVRHGSIKRVASAVGEGSIAIRFIHEYLAETAA